MIYNQIITWTAFAILAIHNLAICLCMLVDPSKEFLAKAGNMDQPERRPSRGIKPQFYITTDKGSMTPSLTAKLQPQISQRAR